MEAAVWTNTRVKSIIENDFVLITLMVDDKTKLPENIEITENGKLRILKTVGDKWSYLQRSKFGANAQPFYIILDNEGLPMSPSYSYDENISKYISFLEKGKKQYSQKSNK
jgi:thiol:disulfide interchange protein DsbD